MFLRNLLLVKEIQKKPYFSSETQCPTTQETLETLNRSKLHYLSGVHAPSFFLVAYRILLEHLLPGIYSGFIALLSDNSVVLTGQSYYPLYEMSVLRAVYEILVPVERKMELRQAVIQSGIIASVGKYTMPWIIDRAVSVLLLTNLRAPQKGHVILKNISANLLIQCILFKVSLSPFFFISYSFLL